MASTNYKTESLVLDAGPLVSLTPLRGLAKKYYTTPQVVAELKDQKARDHWDQLRLLEGVEVAVRNPGVIALSKVTAFAKKSGDYSVLSHPDLCILALTLELDELAKEAQKISSEEVQPIVKSTPENEGRELPEVTQEPGSVEPLTGPMQGTDNMEGPPETLAQRLQRLEISREAEPPPGANTPPASDFTSQEGDQIVGAPQEYLFDSSEPTSQLSDDTLLYDDPSDDDDGEGEWITPTNVNKHKEHAKRARAIPDSHQSETPLAIACMTEDFAMQNVLLQMGLNLVGNEGKRISTIKSWVLRCHACFKICKDSSKKFCPSCGNSTLLRASVTTHAATTPGGVPTMKVHLKQNFQWRTRGTKYSIPQPKVNHAKGGGEASIVLREDQVEWERGVKRENIRQRKEEKRLKRAMEEKDKSGGQVWMDPGWIPDLLVGAGRNAGSGMPAIGYGKRNPNEPRKQKK